MDTPLPDPIAALHAAEPCMADIRALAPQFADWPAARIEALLGQLAETGDDRALSRLLQVSAHLGVQLDPAVLARCIGVCEQLPDTAPCFALSDARAIPPLLAAADDESMFRERRLYAVRVAAELTAKFQLDPAPVRKATWKMERIAHGEVLKTLLAETILLLEGNPPGDNGTTRRRGVGSWIDLPLSVLLPEQRPPAVIGGDYTVRRPIPKLGRNDPCHCGSGKKYKKCCYSSDQALLRDASEHAGATRSALKHNPGLVDDPGIIERMRAYELKTVKPAELGLMQLHAAFHNALIFGLRELAFETLKEIERRYDDPPPKYDPFEELIDEVLEAGDLDLARRIRDHHGEKPWRRTTAIAFLFEMLEHPEHFASLEEACRKSVCAIDDEETRHDEPLIRLALQFASRLPALAIVFARAAIASFPERTFDNETLLDAVREKRIDLDLYPYDDPAEELLDWASEQNRAAAQRHAQSAEVAKLSRQLAATRADLDEKQLALKAMGQRLAEAAAARERPTEAALAAADAPPVAPPADPEKEQTLRRLRAQVEALKAEVSEQQAQRRDLRQALAEEHRKLAALAAASPASAEPAPPEAAVEPAGRPLVPEYADDFRRNCEALPPALAAKAILAAGRFAAHDPAIWHQTKPIERLPEHYRIRVTLDYRLIVRWQPGRSLRVLDVIPRQGLEAWIKRHG